VPVEINWKVFVKLILYAQQNYWASNTFNNFVDYCVHVCFVLPSWICLCGRVLDLPMRAGLGFAYAGGDLAYSGQSGGLTRRRSRFYSRQGRPLHIWMYTLSAVSILGMDMCAIQKRYNSCCLIKISSSLRNYWMSTFVWLTWM
jgi:hypothetical protein